VYLCLGLVAGRELGRTRPEGTILARTTSVRSSKAYFVSQLLILTANSPTSDGREPSRNLRRAIRASGFLLGVTESSRSYAMVSTLRFRVFSRKRDDEEGTSDSQIETTTLSSVLTVEQSASHEW
jgi:hypothetical protein